MQGEFDKNELVDRSVVNRLMQKSDHPTILKFCLHMGLYLACFVPFFFLELPIQWLIPLVAVWGFLTFSIYAPFHETTHQTAFKTPFLNRVGAWISGIPYGYSPGMHRGFHFEHHRYTNEERDPERGFSLPAMPFRVFFQILFAGILGMLVPLHSLMLSFVPTKHWDKFEAGWAPVKERKKLAWGCRFVSALWIAGIYFMAQNSTLLISFLVALFLGRFIHGIITVTEHEGLGEEGPMIVRTRTVVSNRIFRWFWWNMNYHVEHHVWPSIPYHQLPEVHGMIANSGMICEKGYVSFYAENRIDAEAPTIILPSPKRVPEAKEVVEEV